MYKVIADYSKTHNNDIDLSKAIDVTGNKEEEIKILYKLAEMEFDTIDRKNFTLKKDGKNIYVHATFYMTNLYKNGFIVAKEFDKEWISKFYWYGCKHNNVTTKHIRTCLCEYACKDCNLTWILDSSD